MITILNIDVVLQARAGIALAEIDAQMIPIPRRAILFMKTMMGIMWAVMQSLPADKGVVSPLAGTVMMMIVLYKVPVLGIMMGITMVVAPLPPNKLVVHRAVLM